MPGMMSGWVTIVATPTAETIHFLTQTIRKVDIFISLAILTYLGYFRWVLGLYLGWDGSLWSSRHDWEGSGTDWRDRTVLCRAFHGDNSLHGHAPLQTRYWGEVSSLTVLMPDVGCVIFRVRLANFLAPVASETNMGGPLGWIAGFGVDGILDVICKHFC